MQRPMHRAARARSLSREAARTSRWRDRVHRNRAPHRQGRRHCLRHSRAQDHPLESARTPAAILRDACVDRTPRAPINASPHDCRDQPRSHVTKDHSPLPDHDRSASMHSPEQRASWHRSGARQRPFRDLLSGPTGYAPLSRSSNKSETEFGFTCEALTGQVRAMTLRLNIGCWTSPAVECTILAPAQRISPRVQRQ